jgi:hypothetical protein
MDEAFVHVLVEELERNRLRGWHRRGWKDKLKIILKKVLRGIVDTVMNFVSHESLGFHSSWVVF